MEKFCKITNVLHFRLLFLMIAGISNTADVGANLQEASDLLDLLIDESDARLRPGFGGPPLEVNVTVRVYNFGPVAVSQMEYTMNIFLRQEWIDPRLRFVQNTQLHLTSEITQKFWVPDTYFVNEREARYHEVTAKNSLLRISGNGHVLFSTRLTVTIGCAMDLTLFPFDTHVCSFGLESFAYGNTDIQYKWSTVKPLRIDPNVSLPQFTLAGFCPTSTIIDYELANYTRLVTKFYLVRQISYHVLQTYLPSSLLVVLSWISFWLPKNATPARVTLGVTTVLSMTAVMGSAALGLPKLSYIKAIDIFVGVCYVFVFAALLEFAFVNFIEVSSVERSKSPRQEIRNRTGKIKDSEFATSCDQFYNHGLNKNNPQIIPNSSLWKAEPEVSKQRGNLSSCFRRIKTKVKNKRKNTDKYARIVFPVTFLLFQIWYWVFYMILEKRKVNLTMANQNMTSLSN